MRGDAVAFESIRCLLDEHLLRSPPILLLSVPRVLLHIASSIHGRLERDVEGSIVHRGSAPPSGHLETLEGRAPSAVCAVLVRNKANKPAASVDHEVVARWPASRCLENVDSGG